jgi:hypothetical protein
VVVSLATNDTRTSGTSANPPSALTPQQEKRWSEYDQAIRALTPEQLTDTFGTGDVTPHIGHDDGPEQRARHPTPFGRHGP